MTTLTTLRAALEELDYVDSENASEDASHKVRSAMNMLYTLIAAMEKSEPDEYKGWYCSHCQRGVDGSDVTFHEQHAACGRVITGDRPPPAQPVEQPLTEEKIDALWIDAGMRCLSFTNQVHKFTRAVEQAIRSKQA